MPDQTGARTTPSSYFQLVLRRFGEDAAMRCALLEGTGLEDSGVDDFRAPISFAQQLRQIENMNRLFGEGWVLEMPELWRPSAHGSLGVAALTAPTARRAIETLVQFVHARTPNQRLRLAAEPGAAVIRHWTTVELTENFERFVLEIVFLSLSSMLGLMIPASARWEIRYDFPWSEPEYSGRLAERLAGEMRWNATQNGMAIPNRLLSLRSPLEDPAAHRAATERLELSLRAQMSPENLRERVAGLLAHSYTGRVPAPVAARELGVSQRTLVRRLAESQTGYRDLVDLELKTRARRLLDTGVLSRSEVDDRLGFADATGFSRACRRWFREPE